MVAFRFFKESGQEAERRCAGRARTPCFFVCAKKNARLPGRDAVGGLVAKGRGNARAFPRPGAGKRERERWKKVRKRAAEEGKRGHHAKECGQWRTLRVRHAEDGARRATAPLGFFLRGSIRALSGHNHRGGVSRACHTGRACRRSRQKPGERDAPFVCVRGSTHPGKRAPRRPFFFSSPGRGAGPPGARGQASCLGG